MTLVKEKAKKEKYRKRWQRSQTKANGEGQSPRAQLAKILSHSVGPRTHRKLLLQASIIEELKNKYKNTKREREKQMIAKATTGKIIKKYRLQRLAQKTLGFSQKRARLQGDISLFQWTARYRATAREKVVSFFLRDDVS